jgi:hypothetical protein
MIDEHSVSVPVSGSKKGVLMDTRISDKLVRFGRALDIVGKILAIICILGAVLALFTAILAAALPENAIMGILGSIEVTSDVLDLAANTRLGDFIAPAALISLKVLTVIFSASICIYCLLSAIILFILSSVFKATAVHRTPFLQENVKRLKIIGVILFIASFILGLTNLIFAFCVLAFAYVFQYGTELQQQADETL